MQVSTEQRRGRGEACFGVCATRMSRSSLQGRIYGVPTKDLPAAAPSKATLSIQQIREIPACAGMACGDWDAGILVSKIGTNWYYKKTVVNLF